MRFEILVLVLFVSLVNCINVETDVTDVIDRVSLTLLDPFSPSIPSSTFSSSSSSDYFSSESYTTTNIRIDSLSRSATSDRGLLIINSYENNEIIESTTEGGTTSCQCTSTSETSDDFSQSTFENSPETTEQTETFETTSQFSSQSIETDYQSTSDSFSESTSSEFEALSTASLESLSETMRNEIIEITIYDLQRDASKLKKIQKLEISELKQKNENCRNDFNGLINEMKVLRTLIRMDEYTKGLRKKLDEFGIPKKENMTSKSTTINFTVFKIQSDEFLGQIISNRQLQILPPRIGQIIGNVSELSASNVGLVAVNRNAFDELSELKLLNLSKNEISEIENETFIDLEDLEILDLSFNSINSIQVYGFIGLNALENLNLSNNKIEQLMAETFDSLLNLRILDLSFNNLRQLHNEIFTEINVIEEFYINNNQLSVINPLIISDFERAKIIDLRKNKCIDTRFPEKLTMVQIALEVAGQCKSNHNGEL